MSSSDHPVTLLLFHSTPTLPVLRQAIFTLLQTLLPDGLNSLGPKKVLEIAIPLPAGLPASRRKSFPVANSILKAAYGYVADIPPHAPLDCRVILLASPAGGVKPGGVVVDLNVLRSRGGWKDVFVVKVVGSKGEGGLKDETEVKKLLEIFEGRSGREGWKEAMLEVKNDHAAADDWWDDDSMDDRLADDDDMEKGNDIVCVGGTFDALHSGHKLLLTMTAYLLRPGPLPPTAPSHQTFICGLTATELLQNKANKERISKWPYRNASVTEFLTSVISFPSTSSSTSSMSDPAPPSGAPHIPLSPTRTTMARVATHLLIPPSPSPSLHLEVHELHDMFGPTVAQEDLTALCVSEETRNGGDAVNQKRREKGWEELDVFVVGLVQGRRGDRISSTEHRRMAKEKEDGGKAGRFDDGYVPWKGGIIDG